MQDLEKFLELTEKFNLIPIYEEVIMDTETPITLYKKLALNNDYSYLLESVQEGRYSFIGVSPDKVFKDFQNGVAVQYKGKIKFYQEKNLFKELREYLSGIEVKEFEDLPSFSGGFVGYFGYEMIGKYEDIYHKQAEKEIHFPNKPYPNKPYPNKPLSILVLSRLVIAYDHLHNTVKIINNIKVDENMNLEEREDLYYQGKAEIEELISKIKAIPKIYHQEDNESIIEADEFIANISKQEFQAMVKQAKEYIKAGDVFQLVLSQRFSTESKISPFRIFRALRSINPSPYLFYLNFPEVKMIGSSPEVLVRVERERVFTRPLAGTRPRGSNREEDFKLESELKIDDKERAEHIMLLDLACEDLKKICQEDSVEVTELMGVEYYSQVMHLVSQIEGNLKEGLDSLDALKAVFPAGTVSGTPRVKALELIKQLEKEPRGPYGGAVGYLGFNGNLDTCITIRTFIVEDGILSVQVGAGIIVDSVAVKEYEETLNKARALFKAFDMVRKDEIYDIG